LEQLRKRQRDEALHAQEELLAGVAESAASGQYRDSSQIATVAQEAVEPYNRGMSPVLIDITRLPMDEREIDIITVEEDLRALVRQPPSHVAFDTNDLVAGPSTFCCSL